MKKLGTLAFSSAMMLSMCAPTFAAAPTVDLSLEDGVAVNVSGDNGSVGVAVASDPVSVGVDVATDKATVGVDVATDPAAVGVDVATDKATVGVDVSKEAGSVSVETDPVSVAVDVSKEAGSLNVETDAATLTLDVDKDGLQKVQIDTDTTYTRVEAVKGDHFEVAGFNDYAIGYVAFNKGGFTTKTITDYNETDVHIDVETPAVEVVNTNDYVDTAVKVSKDETSVTVNDTAVVVTPESASVTVKDVAVAVAKEAVAVTVKDVAVAVSKDEASVTTPTTSVRVSKTAILNAIAKIKALFADAAL